MRRERETVKSISIEPDPQEELFTSKVNQWVNGAIIYDELMKFYPRHRMSVEDRIAASIKDGVGKVLNGFKKPRESLEV